MHIKRISIASKILLPLGAAALLLAGCSSLTMTNLTSSTLPENPSEIYTFTLRVAKRSADIASTSIAPHIVVDGQDYAMKQSPLGEGIYEFEYQLPPGRDEIAYYYLVHYSVEGNGPASSSEAYSEVEHAKIMHRYVLSLEVNRGPVGASVGVLGRGFTPRDVIAFDGTPARTVFASSTSLGFFVPALASGRDYQVTLNGTTGNSPVGTFRIDPTNVTVQPASLTLSAGGSQAVTFTVANPAPAGGLLLDVTTDVPESVIMPEVIVPQGETSVTATVQAGKPGSGSLFLKGYGPSDVTIPVTVSGK